MTSHDADNQPNPAPFEASAPTGLGDAFDKAAAAYVLALMRAVPWPELIRRGIAEAAGSDAVLARVSELKAAAPANLSVNRAMYHLNQQILGELNTRLGIDPAAYLECIANAREAAGRDDSDPRPGDIGNTP